MSAVTSALKRIFSFLLILAIFMSVGAPAAFAAGETTAEEDVMEAAPLPENPEPAEEEEALPEEETGETAPESEAAEEAVSEGTEPEDAAAADAEATETELPQFSVVVPEGPSGTGAGEELDLSQFDPEDPLYYRMTSGIETLAATSRDTFSKYTPRATNNETVRKGIDVSVWQGSIDWKAVAADGVEFVIIRAAWKSSGGGIISIDTRFVENIKGAKAAGLRVGAYIFSQAITEQEAREEAQYLMNVVAPYEIDLPLVLDYEYYSDSYGNSGRLYNAHLSRQQATNICNAFCEEVEKNGYQSMVYANLSMLNYQLYREQMGRVWLAHVTTKSSYSGAYEFWQCSFNGGVNGISGAVDLDFWFEPNSTSEQPVENKNPFQDVASGAWYYDSVMQAYSEGIVKGISDTSFSPNNTATRGQVVTMIYRMQGEPKTTKTAGFTDLTESYYQDAVNWAAANGVANGISETSFGPSRLITREQLVTMIYRMAGSPAVSGGLSKYSDAKSVSAYATDAMAWAVEKGVITGYADGTLKPGASATRAEVCAILMRYKQLS